MNTGILLIDNETIYHNVTKPQGINSLPTKSLCNTANDDITMYYFNGLSYLNMGNIANFIENESFSIEFWIKLGFIDNINYSKIILRRFNDGKYRGYYVKLSKKSEIEFFFHHNRTTYSYTKSNQPLLFNSWQHIVITHKYNITNIYIDTINTNSKKIFSNLTDETNTLDINSSFIVGGFNGLIDELIIYDECLSIENIIKRYNTYITQQSSNNIPAKSLSDSLSTKSLSDTLLQELSVCNHYSMNFKNVIDNITGKSAEIINGEYNIFGSQYGKNNFNGTYNFGISNVSYITYNNILNWNKIYFQTSYSGLLLCHSSKTSSEVIDMSYNIVITNDGHICIEKNNILYQSTYKDYNDDKIHILSKDNNDNYFIDDEKIIFDKFKIKQKKYGNIIGLRYRGYLLID